ncbi:hypothetical protein D6850_03710 [Roseovarius spongiae]|uniref:Uncharacterized protein n=1 Tax=Roseovarius spongiae TaxID=2320272 RepID=A0A3A8B4K5_9RHOB|nr:hypothetical protein D6850_03710 [Roseovarius spongiae]
MSIAAPCVTAAVRPGSSGASSSAGASAVTAISGAGAGGAMITTLGETTRAPVSGEVIISDNTRGASLGSSARNSANSPFPSAAVSAMAAPSIRMSVRQPGAVLPATSM